MTQRRVSTTEQSAADPRPSAARQWLNFIKGSAYLAGVSFLASSILRYPFAPTFAAVAAGTLSCSAVALVWITLWAQRRESRLGQFGIGSLLFLTLFVAVFCATVRFCATRIMELYPGDRVEPTLTMISVATLTLIGVACSLFFVIRLLESLLNGLTWMIRRPWFRRVWKGLRGKKLDAALRSGDDNVREATEL